MVQLKNIYSFIRGVAIMTPKIKVENSGEQIVSEYLRNRGFNTNTVEKGSGSRNIEVNGKPANFLVQVKSAVRPKMPIFASIEEENNIKTEAEKLGYEAWEARVQMDRKLQPVGEIKWRKLN